jgi:hypothetical protein
MEIQKNRVPLLFPKYSADDLLDLHLFHREVFDGKIT